MRIIRNLLVLKILINFDPDIQTETMKIRCHIYVLMKKMIIPGKYIWQWSFSLFVLLLYLEPGLLYVAYLTIANLAQLGILVLCSVSVFSQAPLLVLDYRWSYNPPTYQRTMIGIEPTPFRNLASKVAGLQVHATTPG